jgi:hypothetical protein
MAQKNVKIINMRWFRTALAPLLRKTPLFLEFSLCLSRACLGKMFGLYINGAKSGVFRTE